MSNQKAFCPRSRKFMYIFFGQDLRSQNLSDEFCLVRIVVLECYESRVHESCHVRMLWVAFLEVEV